jgi:hypothetical protein
VLRLAAGITANRALALVHHPGGNEPALDQTNLWGDRWPIDQRSIVADMFPNRLYLEIVGHNNQAHMALHPSLPALLKDSLSEFLKAAEFCINYRKEDGGSLGCPATALMFSIADSLGSYHRKRTAFKVKVDGCDVSINRNGFQHYYIFNSGYYDLSLSKATICNLYENYRCLLLHNSALMLDGRALFMGSPGDDPFPLDGRRVHVNVPAFFRVTQNAVQTFISEVDRVVPGSDQERIICLKR